MVLEDIFKKCVKQEDLSQQKNDYHLQRSAINFHKKNLPHCNFQ
jgi:negative regulator of sigma E activity